MEPSWFVRPQTKTLTLSHGHWILVRRRLNTGEHRAHLKRSSRDNGDGTLILDSLNNGFSTVLSYLLEWSLTDDEGKPVVIRGVSLDELSLILNNLDPDRFLEIKQAIDAHETAMVAERNAEKNGQDGESTSSAILPSPSVVTGPMSTLAS